MINTKCNTNNEQIANKTNKLKCQTFQGVPKYVYSQLQNKTHVRSEVTCMTANTLTRADFGCERRLSLCFYINVSK